MSSRLPQPDPDWKSNPVSFVVLLVVALLLPPIALWASAQLTWLLSIPYAAIASVLGGLCLLAMVGILGYVWWRGQAEAEPPAESFQPWPRPTPEHTEDDYIDGRVGGRALQPVRPSGGEDSHSDLPFGYGRFQPEQRQRPPAHRSTDGERVGRSPVESAGAAVRAGVQGLPATPQAMLRQPPPVAPSRSAPRPVLGFAAAGARTPAVSLTLEHLQRLLFITGRPGCGKTTILRALARGALTAGRAENGAVRHTVTLDANRSLAEYVAWQSLRAGREPVVLELGARDYLAPYQFPRPGLGGDEAAAEAIRRAWFSFDREIPAQLRDAIVHDFRLLAAGGYGFDQALRILVSEGFRDEVLRQGQARLSHHTGAWVALTGALPRTEWYRKFSSTLARLFQLLENDATRLALAGRGAFSFDRLNDRAYVGPGLDIIVTATGQMDDELIYFVFGILFSELASVLRARLEGAADGRWPEILILADELGRYGGAEAILDLLSSGRNVRVKVAAATHSLMSLPEGLRTLIPVLAVNRIAGGEVGQGAALTADQLGQYAPDLLKARGSDGQPAAYWSAEEQRREFQDWLQQAPDHTFAVRLAGQSQVVRGRALADSELFPAPLALQQALAQAAARSGRPVAAIRQELDQINRDLDARFGPIDRRVEAAPGAPETDWRDAPDDTLPHI